MHNLALSEATRALWLVDNEAGLLDAYRIELSTKFRECFTNILLVFLTAPTSAFAVFVDSSTKGGESNQDTEGCRHTRVDQTECASFFAEE